MAHSLYRSSQQNIPSFEITSEFLASFSTVTQINATPKRNQGLIIDNVDNITISDYVCAIGDIVKPKNVLSASRISNNRVCIYLANKNLVEELTDKYQSLEINQQRVTIRPLISRLKKIIFSNVPSDIPNCFIEHILDQLKVERCSPITTLKATIGKEEYSHVTCFRRQVYIKPEQVKLIPELFKIHFQEMDFHIFAGTDTLRCFLCKQDGHLARQCPNVNNNITQTHNKETPTNEHLTQQDTNTDDNTVQKNKKIINYKSRVENLTQSIGNHNDNKRTRSEISSTDSQNNMERPRKKYFEPEHTEEIPNISMDTELHDLKTRTSQQQQTMQDDISNFTEDHNTVGNRGKQIWEKNTKTDTAIKPPEKKSKATSEKNKSLESMLEPVRQLLESDNQIINYYQFKSLIENVRGTANPREIILEHTNDLEGFILFARNDIYPLLTDRSIKNRITRLINKIKPTTANETTPSQSPLVSDDEMQLSAD